LKAVKRAREAAGDKAPSFGRSWNRDHDGRGGVLGKRRRGSHDASSSDEDVPEDVRKIPMPRDTPPPIPKDVMDKWYAKRRARREAENAARNERDGEKAVPQKEKPVVESKAVYEAKPVMRNLRQEAVSAFVPTSVQMKLNRGQGAAGLLEPEEADRLEQEGYLKLATTSASSQPQTQGESSRKVTVEEADDDED
jgi:hypothetical protein